MRIWTKRATRSIGAVWRGRGARIALLELLKRGLERERRVRFVFHPCNCLDYFASDLCASPSSSGLIRSSGSGNTIVDDLPLLDMSASVCR